MHEHPVVVQLPEQQSESSWHALSVVWQHRSCELQRASTSSPYSEPQQSLWVVHVSVGRRQQVKPSQDDAPQQVSPEVPTLHSPPEPVQSSHC